MEIEKTDEGRIPEFNSERLFSGADFSNQKLEGLSFEECRFLSCKFDYSNLKDTSFTSCVFEESSFVISKFNNTVFNDVLFSGCKMQGLDFGNCNNFLLSFGMKDTILDHVYISEMKLKKTSIVSCRIKATEFSGVDFAGSDFSDTFFSDTIFHRCNLEKADFRRATGYKIDPENNRLKKALFSLPEAASFLSYLDIIVE